MSIIRNQSILTAHAITPYITNPKNAMDATDKLEKKILNLLQLAFSEPENRYLLNRFDKVLSKKMFLRKYSDFVAVCLEWETPHKPGGLFKRPTIIEQSICKNKILVALGKRDFEHLTRKFGLDTPFSFLPEDFWQATSEFVAKIRGNEERQKERRLHAVAEKVFADWTAEIDMIPCPRELHELGQEIVYHDDSEGFVLLKANLEVFIRKARITAALDDLETA